MKTITLNNVDYKLVDEINIHPDRLQATILKENHEVETIAEDAKGNEEITVKKDGEVIGIYRGYMDLLAVSLYKKDEDDVVSVEILNDDMQTQINTLSDTVDENKSLSDTAISSLNNAITNLTPYEETKKGYYGETDKVFYNAPEGNVLVFFDNYSGPYSVNRTENRLIVSFDALEKETNITISIQ